ncbi:MAG TPA: hypothetical protein VLT59_17545 [Steroidobacteraceae bacterium]|nr:hypothetical protein [Steroidobacteraceae bacterium]
MSAAKAAKKQPARRRRVGSRSTPTEPAGGDAAPVRLARVAKGKKPQYFSDPAIDKLLWITMSLIGELSVTRDRLDTVERLLASRKVLRDGDVDAYQPTPAVEAARERRRQAYLSRVLRAVEAELTETTKPDMPKSADEIIAAVSR